LLLLPLKKKDYIFCYIVGVIEIYNHG